MKDSLYLGVMIHLFAVSNLIKEDGLQKTHQVIKIIEPL